MYIYRSKKRWLNYVKNWLADVIQETSSSHMEWVASMRAAENINLHRQTKDGWQTDWQKACMPKYYQYQRVQHLASLLKLLC
jgi:hypothetical protein